MAVQYLCGRKTHKYRNQRSSTSLTLPSSWFLLIIVPVQPRQPPVGLLVTMYPPPVVVRHGWTVNVKNIVTTCDLDGLSIEEAVLTMFVLGLELGRHSGPGSSLGHSVDLSSLVVSIIRVLELLT